MASAAFPDIALEKIGDPEGGGDQLHLLAPFQAKALLNAAVAIHATLPPDQEIADPLWDRSVAHQDTRDEATGHLSVPTQIPCQCGLEGQAPTIQRNWRGRIQFRA